MVFLGCLLNPVVLYKNFEVIFDVFSKFCVGGWFFCYNINIKKKANTFTGLFIFETDVYLTLWCKIQTRQYGIVDISYHFDTEIGKK